MSAEEARERISAALDAIDAAHDVLRDTSRMSLATPFASRSPSGWKPKSAAPIVPAAADCA